MKSNNTTNNYINSSQNKPQNSVWKGKNSELCITFEKDKLFLWFSYLGQCIYEFPVNKVNNKFDVFWKINEDCVFESGLKKTYGLNNYPKDNEIFMVLELIDNTTINVSYNYPEWIEKFNQFKFEYGIKKFDRYTIDSSLIFPNQFIVDKYYSSKKY